ncbi:MAG: DNA polymerase IV [Clostridia bacterium]|nr:DNA polymerase IV [Clostridia bacterium]
MSKIIIHVDMDAFYAAVEVRDNPELAGKSLIIGALPSERGVVSTCSYEARKYGIRSAMSIKTAYRLCPHGVYMHPNMHKYVEASNLVHQIWDTYTDLVEHISLDEGFLDVTNSAHLFGGPRRIGHEIKERVQKQVGLTCSVGIGYSLMSAKLASEEKKPDGYFEIPSAQALQNLIMDRSVRVIYGVGAKTAESLQLLKIRTVRDLVQNRQTAIHLLGNHGKHILELADGIDNRTVTSYADPKSLGKEHTFQQDIGDFDYLKDVLRLIAAELSFEMHQKGLYCRTVTLKVTYDDMQQITRSKSGEATNKAGEIYVVAVSMLDKIEKRPIRLVGISLSGFTEHRQMSFSSEKEEAMDKTLFGIQQRYGRHMIKTGSELGAQKRLGDGD